jgi:hypothetical protein
LLLDTDELELVVVVVVVVVFEALIADSVVCSWTKGKTDDCVKRGAMSVDEL